MKLKKLLPIAAVASTAVVVAPLVTSCGYKTYIFEMVDGEIDESQFKVKPKASTPIAENNALKVYLTDAKANKRIIAEDFFRSQYLQYSNKPDGTATFKFGVGSIDPNTGKVSVQIDAKGKMDDEAMEQFVEIKNLEWVVNYIGDSDDNVVLNWEFNLKANSMETTELLQMLKNDKTWSYTSRMTGTPEKHFDYKNISDGNIEDFKDEIGDVEFVSWYFQNVTKA